MSPSHEEEPWASATSFTLVIAEAIAVEELFAIVDTACERAISTVVALDGSMVMYMCKDL